MILINQRVKTKLQNCYVIVGFNINLWMGTWLKTFEIYPIIISTNFKSCKNSITMGPIVPTLIIHDTFRAHWIPRWNPIKWELVEIFTRVKPVSCSKCK